MIDPVIHVVALSGAWAVRKEGSLRASRVFDSKSQAEDWARTASRQTGSELVIHRKDGMVERIESNTAARSSDR